MAATSTKAGSSRWFPYVLMVVAAIQSGDLLAQAFVWHAAVVLIEAQAALAGLFAVLAILSFWDLRRHPAPLARAADF
ncbi:MAG: hypothetical protein L3K05_08625 [Thermoplasmata archaeon]|nr:hypothetical protein [Thermoplasmata archaeon]